MTKIAGSSLSGQICTDQPQTFTCSGVATVWAGICVQVSLSASFLWRFLDLLHGHAPLHKGLPVTEPATCCLSNVMAEHRRLQSRDRVLATPAAWIVTLAWPFGPLAAVHVDSGLLEARIPVMSVVLPQQAR